MDKYKTISAEDFIPLISSRREIWDQTSSNYSNKKLKAKAWKEIAETLNVSVSAAKVRWTNLRDFFRREMKKVVRKASETGNPDAYVPRWRNFESMSFMKDLVLKTLTLKDSNSSYPQDALEDEEMGFEDYYDEENSSTSFVEHDFEIGVASPDTSNNRTADSNGWPKKQRTTDGLPDDNAESGFDGDYHFAMSILPSIRQIRQDRKTSFKMKVLKLIMEEENYLQQ